MKYRKDGNRIFLTLAKGDYINQNFETFAGFEGIGCAWLHGLGALEDPEIGFQNINYKSYHRKKFVGEFELTSLVGNITLKEGKPFSHTHITFSDTEYCVFGGHLFDAKITVAGEFIMKLVNDKITREMNHGIGLSLWCLEGTLD